MGTVDPLALRAPGAQGTQKCFLPNLGPLQQSEVETLGGVGPNKADLSSGSLKWP